MQGNRLCYGLTDGMSVSAGVVVSRRLSGVQSNSRIGTRGRTSCPRSHSLRIPRLVFTGVLQWVFGRGRLGGSLQVAPGGEC